MYTGDDDELGNVKVDNTVYGFFVECDHLRDWLAHDNVNAPQISQSIVDTHRDASPPLQTCSAVCNSHKHHTRRRGQVTARIRDMEITSTAARVTIEVDWSTPSASTVDALDLADQCLASWRSFFSTHGLAEPT